MYEVDRHGRTILGGNSACGNLAESVIQKLNKDYSDVEMVKKMHDRARLRPSMIQVLLKRSGRSNPRTMKAVNYLNDSCHLCLKSEEPRNMKKFSVSKLN